MPLFQAASSDFLLSGISILHLHVGGANAM
jgi:hypothetical protein